MNSKNKYQNLVISLILDAVGYLSFIIPGIGEFSDIVWAPLTAYIMTKMYQGKKGKIAGTVAFIEEVMPGLDIIPTFTLMWLFTHVFSPSKKSDKTI